MAMFGFGKSKEGAPGLDQILAYLEEALRARSPFTVSFKGGETSAFLHSVNEEASRFQLLPREDLPVDKGGKVAFTFIHDGLRIGGTGLALEVRPGILALKLPESLELMERRRKPRARLNPKEGATVTALQDLAKGVGITSDAENISEGGCRVRVTKAMAVGSEKRLVIGTNLVPPGSAFMLIKLNNLPRCPPVVEAAGRVAYLAHEAAGLVLGFAFNSLPGPVEGVLRNLVGSRTTPAPAVLPPKVRRRPDPREAEEPVAPAAESLPAAGDAQAPAPEPSTPQEQPAAEALVQVPMVERRQAPRLSLGSGFHARFMIGEHLFAEVDLLDMSAGGCCLRLPQALSEGFRKGAALDEFHFVHPDLPQGVLQGRVKWVLGRNAGAAAATGPRYCLVGVEFALITAGLAQAIESYVASRL